jgi:hypothetical protein
VKLSLLSESDEEARRRERELAAGGGAQAQQAAIAALLRQGKVTEQDIRVAALCSHEPSVQYYLQRGHTHVPGLRSAEESSNVYRMNVLLAAVGALPDGPVQLMTGVRAVVQQAVSMMPPGAQPQMLESFQRAIIILDNGIARRRFPEYSAVTIPFDRVVRAIGRQQVWEIMRQHLVHPELQKI